MTQASKTDISELEVPFAEYAQEIVDRLPDRSEEDEQQRRIRAAIDRQDRLVEFHRAVGERLAEATLENYVCREPGQARVVEALQEYASNIVAEVAAGAGIVLFGPSGSGKDHLLTALGRVAIGKYGLKLRWSNGMDLLGELRDRIAENEAEEQWVKRMARPDVLYISDPIPPRGELTTYQSSMLGRVLDRRHRDRRPTWVSMNVSHSTEADAIMGAPLVDRLKAGAIAAFCNWPSYRKSRLVWDGKANKKSRG